MATTTRYPIRIPLRLPRSYRANRIAGEQTAPPANAELAADPLAQSSSNQLDQISIA
jgi:hypothetical protein